VYIVGRITILSPPLISITAMKRKSNRRSFKPFNELPPGFKNLVNKYLIDTNPIGFQIASNSQYELENFWSVLFSAGTKGQQFTVHSVLADGAYFSGRFTGWLDSQGLDFCIRTPLNSHLKKELSLVKKRLKKSGDTVFLHSTVLTVQPTGKKK